MRGLVFFAALVLAPGVPGAGPALAQEPAPPPADSATDETAVATVADEDARRGPAPMSAFLRSIVVPGWGQLAADRPVRAAFYFTMQSATVFMVLRTNRRIGEAEGEGLKEARREQREDWLVLAGFWALASGIDAWVSAHLWKFEGEVVPPPDGSPGVALQFRLPAPGF